MVVICGAAWWAGLPTQADISTAGRTALAIAKTRRRAIVKAVLIILRVIAQVWSTNSFAPNENATSCVAVA